MIEPFFILIVDDDTDLRANLAEILQMEGYTVAQAANGQSALEFSLSKRIELALVDIRLPDMTGLQLVDQLMQHSPYTDYIIVTGNASLESALNAIRTKSILAYETKPLDVPRLLTLIHQVSERRRLERELVNATEEERSRFGRELHDGLGQELTSIALQAQFLAETLKAKNEPNAEVATSLAKMINQTIVDVKRIARGLAPISLETKGLKGALEELINESNKTSSIACVFHCSPDAKLPEDANAVHFYRIVQEAIQNATKHSDATEIEVTIERIGDDEYLKIADNGHGLSDKNSDIGGMGIKTMQYRAALLGGDLVIEPSPSQGTCIRLRYRIEHGNN